MNYILHICAKKTKIQESQIIRKYVFSDKLHAHVAVRKNYYSLWTNFGRSRDYTAQRELVCKEIFLASPQQYVWAGPCYLVSSDQVLS